MAGGCPSQSLSQFLLNKWGKLPLEFSVGKQGLSTAKYCHNCLSKNLLTISIIVLFSLFSLDCLTYEVIIDGDTPCLQFVVAGSSLHSADGAAPG